MKEIDRRFYLKAARELGYGLDCIREIKEATTERACERILTNYRHNCIVAEEKRRKQCS